MLELVTLRATILTSRIVLRSIQSIFCRSFDDSWQLCSCCGESWCRNLNGLDDFSANVPILRYCVLNWHYFFLFKISYHVPGFSLSNFNLVLVQVPP